MAYDATVNPNVKVRTGLPEYQDVSEDKNNNKKDKKNKKEKIGINNIEPKRQKKKLNEKTILDPNVEYSKPKEKTDILDQLTPSQKKLYNQNLSGAMSGDVFDKYKAQQNQRMASAAQNVRAQNARQNFGDVGQGSAELAQNQAEQDVFGQMAKHDQGLAAKEAQFKQEANRQALNTARADADYQKLQEDLDAEQTKDVAGYLMNRKDTAEDWNWKSDALARQKLSQMFDLNTTEGKRKADSFVKSTVTSDTSRKINQIKNSEFYDSLDPKEKQMYDKEVLPAISELQHLGYDFELNDNGELVAKDIFETDAEGGEEEMDKEEISDENKGVDLGGGAYILGGDTQVGTRRSQQRR